MYSRNYFFHTTDVGLAMSSVSKEPPYFHIVPFCHADLNSRMDKYKKSVPNRPLTYLLGNIVTDPNKVVCPSLVV